MRVEPTNAGERSSHEGTHGDSAARFSFENGLVDVDASLRMPVVARLCRERGYLFPLARPLPAFSLAKACAKLPFFTDAYVSSVDAVTDAGQALSTGRAPRAATGPDLVGAVCCEPPLAVATRVRLRVLDAKSARTADEHFADLQACLSSVARWLEEGRAFALHAFGDADGYRVAVVGGPAAVPHGAPVTNLSFGEGGAPSIVSSRSLVPGDALGLRAALADGARVVAAPYMGRLAALFSVDVAPPAGGKGAPLLAAALARAAGGSHG